MCLPYAIRQPKKQTYIFVFPHPQKGRGGKCEKWWDLFLNEKVVLDLVFPLLLPPVGVQPQPDPGDRLGGLSDDLEPDHHPLELPGLQPEAGGEVEASEEGVWVPGAAWPARVDSLELVVLHPRGDVDDGPGQQHHNAVRAVRTNNKIYKKIKC